MVGCVSAAIATTGGCRRAAAATRRCSVASRVVVAVPVCRVVAFVVHGNKGGQLEQASQVVPRVVASNKVVLESVCVCTLWHVHPAARTHLILFKASVLSALRFHTEMTSSVYRIESTAPHTSLPTSNFSPMTARSCGGGGRRSVDQCLVCGAFCGVPCFAPCVPIPPKSTWKGLCVDGSSTCHHVHWLHAEVGNTDTE